MALGISFPPSFIFLLFAISSLLFTPIQAQTLQEHSWISTFLPQKGTTFADEIRCYSLPYGGIGFLSHILTYWAILWIGFGRKPYFPFSPLSAGKFDICLAIGQITITVAVAAITIARCLSRWQFILIAVWKLLMSLFVGIWGFAASIRAIKEKKGHLYQYAGTGPDEGKTHKQYMWFSGHIAWPILIYGPAAVIGLVGVLSLAIQEIHDPQVWKITLAFGVSIAASVLFCLVLASCVSERCCTGLWTGLAAGVLGAVPSLMIALTAFYSDWILGAIAHNLLGVPSGDAQILYWGYFAAKRLPLLFT